MSIYIRSRCTSPDYLSRYCFGVLTQEHLMMFKYSLIILAFWYQVQGQSSDTPNLPLTPNLNKANCNAVAEEADKKPAIIMNGHNNVAIHHVGQQIFYLYNEQQKRLSLIDKDTELSRKDDYLVTPGVGAHKLHLRKLAWNNARQTCVHEGGHLAIINSASEEKILLRMLQEANLNVAWLGLHDLYEEGTWVTVLDVALENTGYTRWTTKWHNEPDNFGGDQNCAALIFPEGGMDDVKCDVPLSFFCELAM